MGHEIVPNSCRICLCKVNKLRTIYNQTKDGDTTPIEMLHEITGIILEGANESPELPKSICNSCVQSLTEAFRFRTKALETQEIIQSYCKNLLRESAMLQVKLELEEEEFVNVDKELKYFTESKQEEFGISFCDNGATKSEEQIENMILDIKVEEEVVEENSDNAEEIYTVHILSNGGDDDDNDRITNSLVVDKNLTESGLYDQRDQMPIATHGKRRSLSKLNPIPHENQYELMQNYSWMLESVPSSQTPEKKGNDIIEDSEGSYKCDICGKSFAKRRYVVKHRQRHYNELRHTCNLCHKRFKDRSSFKRHKVVHSDHKPYVCDVCNKAFKRSTNLNNHKSIHIIIKSYHCKYCNKNFRQQITLQKHLSSKEHQKAIRSADKAEFVSAKIRNMTLIIFAP